MRVAISDVSALIFQLIRLFCIRSAFFGGENALICHRPCILLVVQ